MDALALILVAELALIALDIAALTFGVDSRDGFTDDEAPRGLT